MKTVELNVKGMHCASCAILIKDALLERGVKTADVNVKKNVAVIVYDEKSLDEKKLIQVIKDEGCDAALRDN